MRLALVIGGGVVAVALWDQFQPAELPAWFVLLPVTYLAGMILLND